MQVKWPSWDQGPELLIPKCVLITRLLPTVREEQGRTDQKGLGKDDREQRAEWGEAPTAASWPCRFAGTKHAFLIGNVYGWSDFDHTVMERPPLVGDHLPLSHNAYHCNGSSFSSKVCLVPSRALSPSNTSAH